MISCDCCSRTLIVWPMLFRQDIYRDMAEDAATHYDFSDYPLDHPLYSAMNCKAIGFFMDELNSVPMQQFVGMRPKCYAFLCTGKVSNNAPAHQPCGEVDNKGCQALGEGCSPAFCILFGRIQQFSYISLWTEPDRVYPAHCAHSSHVQGRLDSI